jgi:hypothetical protein
LGLLFPPLPLCACQTSQDDSFFFLFPLPPCYRLFHRIASRDPQRTGPPRRRVYSFSACALISFSALLVLLHSSASYHLYSLYTPSLTLPFHPSPLRSTELRHTRLPRRRVCSVSYSDSPLVTSKILLISLPFYLSYSFLSPSPNLCPPELTRASPHATAHRFKFAPLEFRQTALRQRSQVSQGRSCWSGHPQARIPQ